MNIDHIFEQGNSWFILEKVGVNLTRIWWAESEGATFKNIDEFRRRIKEDGSVDTGWHKDDIEIYKLQREL